jgi:esterase/lipase superfamily enzyme
MTEIFFASNRDVLRESSARGNVFGSRFNADGPQCFRVGSAEVSLKARAKPEVDEAWKVGATKLYSETLDSSQPAGAKLGSARLFEELRQHLRQEDRDVIVYLHGFANSFENSLQRAASLEELYNRGGEQKQEDQEVILAARRDGTVPNPADLVQCVRRLHLLAHSMGNRALRHAVHKFIELSGGRVPRVFDCAFLMAADEDHDALQFPQKLKPLDALANRIFVYHAAKDVALAVSDRTKGNSARLGADGPQNFDLTSERVMALDCRDISKTTTAHGRHQYYRLRPEALADVQATLADEPQIGRLGRQEIRPGRSWRLRSAS